MSISDNYVPIRQLGNGVTTNYSGSWAVLASAYLKVYWEDAITGVQTLKLLGTHYNLVFDASGFTVTFLPSFIPTSAEYVVIGREVTQDQNSPYKTSKGFQGDVIENSFDKLTAITQDLADGISRSFKVPLGSVISADFPVPDAGKALVWNSAEDGLENSTINITADVDAALAAAASVTYLWCGTATGTANALVLTPSTPIASNLEGQKFRFLIGTTNTSGTVTIAVSGQSALTVVKSIGGALVALAIGDLPAGTIAEVENTGTQLQLMNVRPYSQGADIASAATVVLDTSTGDYVNITGTTGITAITLAQGQQRTVKFAGILTLTNGASLILPSGANITTAAGDTAVFRGEASGVVRCVAYTRADGRALIGSTGKATLGRSKVVSTSRSNNGASFIPADDTVPQSGEGFEVLTITYSRVSATSKIIVNWEAWASNGTLTGPICSALIRDAAANAVATGPESMNNTFIGLLEGEYEETSGATGNVTFAVRIGAASGTTYFNQPSGGGLYGSTIQSYIEVTEIEA